jgi:hypothetical protein
MAQVLADEVLITTVRAVGAGGHTISGLELAHFAVNTVGSLIAGSHTVLALSTGIALGSRLVLSELTSGADVASVLVLDGSEGARVAGEAFAERVVIADTALHVAVVVLGELRAANTSKGSLSSDAAGASAATTIADAGACTPCAEVGEPTINRTFEGVAVLLVGAAWADLAPVLRRNVSSTASFVTGTTREGAGVERTPCTNDAILGAGLDRARADILLGRAGLASMLGLLDGARASPFAATAGFGASVPLAPCADDAIFRALVVVAVLVFGEFRADVASVGVGGGHGTGASVSAAIASLAALPVVGPAADHAVDRALAKVARARLVFEATGFATVQCTGDDALGLGLAAFLAGGGALGPVGPVGERAVDGALHQEALTALRKAGARLTAVLCRLDDSSVAILGTLVAAL